MANLHDETGRRLAELLGVERARIVNCAAAGIVVVSAAFLLRQGADPRQLPWDRPARRKILLPKGQVLNFSAEVTQMVRMSGAEVLEIGAVNACGADVVRAACRGGDIAGAVFVPSLEAFPYGTVSMAEYIAICREHHVPVLVDAAALPLIDAVIELRPDVILCSPHKFMGSPTAGVILGAGEIVDLCASMEGSFARAFKTSKETLAAVEASLRWWNQHGPAQVHVEWERLALRAHELFGSIRGFEIKTVRPRPPIGGVHVSLNVSEEKLGMTAVEVANALITSAPFIAVNREEADLGNLTVHFAMLNEEKLKAIARRLSSLSVSSLALEGVKLE